MNHLFSFTHYSSRAIPQMLILVLLVFICIGCRNKELPTETLAFSQYLDQTQKAVIDDLAERKIDLDERSDPESGYIILSDTICDIPFLTIINFGSLPNESEPLACNIMRQAIIDLSQEETRDHLNKLYAMMKRIYGDPVESGSSIIEVSGVTYTLSDIPNDSIKKLFNDGKLFDEKEITALELGWMPSDGSAVSLTISEQTGVKIYEQSAKTTEALGTTGIID